MNAVSHNREILRLALPSIVQNVTVPLLGLVDLAIVGHMGATSYIAAVSIGSMIFNVMYWLLGFLRMGTSGLTSQALGRRNFPEVMLQLRQALTVALLLALCFLVAQPLIRFIALRTMLPDVSVSQASLASEVTTYFNICIWGAPAMLSLYVLTGWFIGMQNTRIPMVVAIVQNIVNMLLSFTLVYVFGMGIDGVATGTLVAQWCGLAMAVVMWKRNYGRLRTYDTLRQSWHGMRRFF